MALREVVKQGGVRVGRWTTKSLTKLINRGYEMKGGRRRNDKASEGEPMSEWLAAMLTYEPLLRSEKTVCKINTDGRKQGGRTG